MISRHAMQGSSVRRAPGRLVGCKERAEAAPAASPDSGASGASPLAAPHFPCTHGARRGAQPIPGAHPKPRVPFGRGRSPRPLPHPLRPLRRLSPLHFSWFSLSTYIHSRGPNVEHDTHTETPNMYIYREYMVYEDFEYSCKRPQQATATTRSSCHGQFQKDQLGNRALPK